MVTSLNGSKIAYFSMEIGIRNDMHTFSGGLGVLAGDTVRSSADLSVPMVAVALVSRKGYVYQKLTGQGDQIDYVDEWNPARLLELAPAIVEVKIEGRPVKVQAWVYEHKSTIGGTVPILFLDTNMEANTPEDRAITDTLYGGDERYRFKQEIVLGIGGTRMLDALNIHVSKYHMNEGHSSLLTLELLRRYDMEIDQVLPRCVFTTHTPLEAAFDKFSYDLVQQVLGQEFPLEVMKEVGGEDKLNMTLLALNLSGYQNGVTKAHSQQSLKIFPHYAIRAITNGVHSNTWTSPSFHQLFDKYVPGWASEPEMLVRIAQVPLCDIWDAHMKNKHNLVTFVQERTGEKLDESALTLGFARRVTGYKRAKLIFSDLNYLREINKRYPIQLVFAGKAHPRDTGGKDLIREIFWYKMQLRGEIKVAYIENYDMEVAAKLVAGVDVWLNTPLPPLEASGTSGMKAAHNGVVNFSVLDGWWIEGCMEGITGWAIGPPPGAPVTEEERRKSEVDDVFNKLKYLIAPKFYENRDAWTEVMKNSIGKVAYYFNTNRMMRRYITEAYFP